MTTTMRRTIQGRPVLAQRDRSQRRRPAEHEVVKDRERDLPVKARIHRLSGPVTASTVSATQAMAARADVTGTTFDELGSVRQPASRSWRT